MKESGWLFKSQFPDLYETFIHNLTNNINFHFTHWGDGEFAWFVKSGPKWDALSKRYPNDAHYLDSKLERIILSNPSYFFGIQQLAIRIHGDELNKYTDNLPNKCDAASFHNASMKGTLNQFVDAVKHRKLLLVGPEYLKKIKIHNHIIIPRDRAWLEGDKIKEKIVNRLEDDIVVMYCVSFISRIWLDELSSENITQLDIGSVFDPYCDYNCRTYHQSIMDRGGELVFDH